MGLYRGSNFLDRVWGVPSLPGATRDLSPQSLRRLGFWAWGT